MTNRQTKFRRRDVNGLRRRWIGLSSRRWQLHRRRRRYQAGNPQPLANALRTTRSTFERLSWSGFAVRKNVRNRRRKVINTGAGHDDAVSAAMSFLGDAQEPPALIFSELDVEALALDLEFSRLDDVIHFALRPPSLGIGRGKWKKNS